MDALVVVDMQEAMLRGAPKHDLQGVVARIDRLASRVRSRGGGVWFVQHDGPDGDDFAPHTPGWQLLGSLRRAPGDAIVRKTANDAFLGTGLASQLRARGVDRLLVAGWATDLCVDATVRSAATRDFRVVVVSDAHTVSDRPHLPAERVIEHHHWIWQNLVARHPVGLAGAESL